MTIRMASLDILHGHSAFVLPGWQNRTREETREGSPSSISEAGRITPLALNGQMRASEPEG